MVQKATRRVRAGGGQAVMISLTQSKCTRASLSCLLWPALLCPCQCSSSFPTSPSIHPRTIPSSCHWRCFLPASEVRCCLLLPASFWVVLRAPSVLSPHSPSHSALPRPPSFPLSIVGGLSFFPVGDPSSTFSPSSF